MEALKFNSSLKPEYTKVRQLGKTNSRVILFPRRFCETRAGNLAHAIGRIVFKPGQPMLVEHVGGLYLEHDLTGRVITPGYGDDYQITHVYAEGES